MRDRIEVAADDRVPEGWMDGTEPRTVKDWGQREYLSGRRLGAHLGVMFAKRALEAEAARLFVAKDEERARVLRDAAASLEGEWERKKAVELA